MNALEIFAFVVASTVCFLPGIMAWNHFFGGEKKAESKKAVLTTKTAASKA